MKYDIGQQVILNNVGEWCAWDIGFAVGKQAQDHRWSSANWERQSSLHGGATDKREEGDGVQVSEARTIQQKARIPSPTYRSSCGWNHILVCVFVGNRLYLLLHRWVCWEWTVKKKVIRNKRGFVKNCNRKPLRTHYDADNNDIIKLTKITTNGIFVAESAKQRNDLRNIHFSIYLC